jgi:iron complex outermembrane recepter protein
MSTPKYSFVAAAILLSSVFSIGANAEDLPASPSSQSNSDQSEIPEILVTARRRAENLQTTPVSVTALSAQEMLSANVTDLTDLTNVTSGLRFTGEGSGYNTNITLRGLDKNASSSASSPSVVIYFADVPRTGEAQSLPVYDLEDVEVLKGPQGTLFGRNALGGAILLNPKKPTFDDDGYVRASVGNFDYSAVEAALNIPILNDVAVLRVAGQIRRRDGFARDLTYGEKLENVDQDSMRVSLLLQPADRLSNTTVADYFDSHEAGNALVLVGVNPGIVPFIDPLLQTSLTQQEVNGPRNVVSSVPDPFVNVSNIMVANTTVFTVNRDFSIKNVLGFQKNKESLRQNSDGLDIPGIILNKIYVSNVYTQSFSEELQFEGKALNDKLNSIGGAFYSNQTPAGTQGTNSQSFSFFGSSPPTASSTYIKIRSEAIYEQVGYDLSSIASGLKLDAGVRYTWEQLRQCGGNLANIPTDINDFISYDGCNALAATNQPGLGILESKEGAPTWTVGLDYQATDRVFLYVVSRRGFREGGINSPLFDTPNTTANGPGQRDLRPYQTWNPETLTDVEIGAKTNWEIGGWNGKTNIAVFRGVYKNAVQFINVVGQITPDAGFPQFGSFGYNSGQLTLSGVELDAAVSPLRGLTFSGNASYFNQKVDSVNTVAPFATPVVNLPSPKVSYTLAGDWVIPYQPFRADIVAHADFFYTQKYQVQTANVPGYQLTNARLDFNHINGTGLSASLFLANAFDKVYIKAPSIVLPGFPSNTATFGEPRMYGVEFTYRW